MPFRMLLRRLNAKTQRRKEERNTGHFLLFFASWRLFLPLRLTLLSSVRRSLPGSRPELTSNKLRRLNAKAQRRKEERVNGFFLPKFVILVIGLMLSLPLALNALPGYEGPWGKDTDLNAPRTTAVEKPKPSLAVRMAEQAILFHQNVITQVDGPRSHFRPSSSAYMRQAMHEHGFIKGFLMGCDRLLRENDAPWVYRTIEVDGKLYKYDPPPKS